MSTDVHVIRPPDFVRAKADGHADLALAERLLSDIAEKIRDLEQFNALVDVRTVSGALLTSDELWYLAEKFALRIQTRRCRIALLCPADRFENVRFFALSAAVRAQKGAQVQPFTSYEEAMDWLCNSAID
jgi:hypothetical protein